MLVFMPLVARCQFLALEGPHEIAQGTALGHATIRRMSPEGAKSGSVCWPNFFAGNQTHSRVSHDETIGSSGQQLQFEITMTRGIDAPETIRPIVILACPVFRVWLEANLPEALADRIAFLDEGLHARPAGLRHALQTSLDGLPQPSVVAFAYGLCGNGLHGLQAGAHTLLIPRSHDCIAILLGSHAARQAHLEEEPGTYVLSPGWIASGKNPLDESRALAAKYGAETAAWLMDAQYRHYRRLVLVGQEPCELEAVRPKALEIAEYCARWGMRYEERLGSGDYLRRLLAALPVLAADGRGGADISGEDFLIIPPGGVVHQSMFQR